MWKVATVTFFRYLLIWTIVDCVVMGIFPHEGSLLDWMGLCLFYWPANILVTGVPVFALFGCCLAWKHTSMRHGNRKLLYVAGIVFLFLCLGLCLLFRAFGGVLCATHLITLSIVLAKRHTGDDIGGEVSLGKCNPL